MQAEHGADDLHSKWLLSAELITTEDLNTQ